MTELRRLRSDDGPKESRDGTNRIIDVLLGNAPGRIALLDDDGVKKDIRGGNTLGTAEPALKIRSAAGEHALFEHSDKTRMILEIQDSGVSFGADFPVTFGEWTVEEDADDLVWKEDAGAERVRFGDSSSTYALLVTGDQRVTSSMVINDWKASVSGDDLVWTDDGNVEKVRFGDSSSTFALIATGDIKTTTALTINDWKGSVSGDDLVWVDDAGAERVRFGDTSSTYALKSTGPAQITGLLQLENQLQFGANVASTGLIRSTSAFTAYARKAANDGDVRLLSKDASDNVFVGDAATTASLLLDATAAGAGRIGGSNVLVWQSTGVSVTGTLTATDYIQPGSMSGTPAANVLYRDQIVKGWVVFAADATVNASANVTGVSKTVAGDWTITWDRDFVGTNYVVIAVAQSNSAYFVHVADASFAAGTSRVICRDAAGSTVDPTRVHVMAIGAQ